jgi:hypothetical protein
MFEAGFSGHDPVFPPSFQVCISRLLARIMLFK